MLQAIDENAPALVLLLAASLDYLIGDPWGWLHPVQVMGWFIDRYSRWAIARFSQPRQRRWAGIVLGVGLIAGSGCAGWAIVWGTTQLHPWLGIAIAAILLASCFAGRSLRAAAMDVLQPLREGNLAAARSRLQLYVGRDTDRLSQAAILRAVLETVAENTTDGTTAPLFYAIIGALIPGVGSVPLTLAYKAASTLDSMVGYQKEPYTDLGWFSAQFEDVLTWFPCRLTVLTIALCSRKPRTVLRLCRRDANQDPSPNSGWSECAYAAALKVQLGGENYYGGEVKHKPLLGEPEQAITAATIAQALQITRTCSLLGLIAGLGLWWGLKQISS